MFTNITFSGKVVRGDNVGKKLGFPTANIGRRHFSKLSQKPKFGIYSGYVILPKKRINKATFVIGPLDQKGLPKLEAHLLNFKGDLYGQKIIFVLEKFLRPFKKFRMEKELIAQIKKDLRMVKSSIKHRH